MALQVDSLPVTAEAFQAYLDELRDEQLTKLDTELTEKFRVDSEKDDPDMGNLTNLKSQVDWTRSESAKREAEAAKTRAAEAEVAHKQALAELSASVLGKKSAGTEVLPAPAPSSNTELAEQFAAILSEAFGKTTQNIVAAGNADLNSHVRNLPLSQVRTPDSGVLPERREAVIVASADIPGVAKDGKVKGIGQLVTLLGDRARMMSVTRGKPNYVNVAKLVRDFRYRLNLDSTPDEIDEVLTAATDVGALVAAGGWCAPSEISYDFFNIVCEDGLLDLPSVGVLNRGGFRFPVSPTIADIFADSPSPIWSWTEEMDISAGEGGPQTKSCARVDCPTFDEVRALCDGLCVTAGNLTDFAYPELVANYIRLVMAARAHQTNASVIAQLVAASDAVSMVAGLEGAAASILNSIELQAFDYRERYRMCADAILEAVFPRWALGAIRADLANRGGVNLLGVTDGMIADWLNLRNIRAQFVADWQSGFTGEPIGAPAVNAVAWPTTVEYLLYAPGTFVRGQGLQLDLGVVRDSTLNATNDHTAAWMEDCYAVATVGHESRIVTTDICTAGLVGAPDVICGSL